MTAAWDDPSMERTIVARTEVLLLRDGRVGTVNPDDPEQVAAARAAAEGTWWPDVARWIRE